MARTPRTISRRGHPEAKAGENIGQGKPREDVTEKAMQRIQREAISEVSLTRSPSRFVGVLRLPRLRTTRFHGGGLRDDRTWREGVLSLKQRRCNETNQYHPAQQSPHENDWLPWNENVHGRPPRDEERLTFRYYNAKKHTCSMGNPVQMANESGATTSAHPAISRSCKLGAMTQRKLNKDDLARHEDWYGNNVSIQCPVCGKVYIASKFLNEGFRQCPSCGKSSNPNNAGRHSENRNIIGMSRD